MTTVNLKPRMMFYKNLPACCHYDTTVDPGAAPAKEKANHHGCGS